jgi:hypothetical protein
MSFTRYHDDPVRIAKGLEQSTFAGRYLLDTPGPGIQMPFIEDPQLRIQRWGANMWSDSTNLESELRGLGRPLNHDVKTYQETRIHNGYQISFPSHSAGITDESRATHPAWMYKDLEQTRWEVPLINPQANVFRPFDNLTNTRILAKDEFARSRNPVPFHGWN